MFIVDVQNIQTSLDLKANSIVTDLQKGGHCYLHGNEGNNSFNCRNLATASYAGNQSTARKRTSTTESELLRCRYNEYEKELFSRFAEARKEFQASLQGERT
jgi:hypothetical protein